MLRRLILAVAILLAVFSGSACFAKAEDVVKMYSDIYISPEMSANDVVAVGGNVTVSGKVNNNIVAVCGTITLNEGAYVGGEVVSIGGKVKKSENAFVKERITEIYMPHFLPSVINMLKGKWFLLLATVSLLAILGFIGLAVLIIALIPKNIHTAVSAMDHSFWKMLLWGIVWTLLIVPIMVLLAISIVGIFLIPLVILLLALAMIIGVIAASVFIGKHTISILNVKVKWPFVDVIIGITLLSLINLIPIIGPVIKMIFSLAGFGAVIVTRGGTVR